MLDLEGMAIPTGAPSDSAMSPRYGSWPGCQALLRLQIPPKNLLKSGTLRNAPADFLANSCNLQQQTKHGTQFLVSEGSCTQHLISLTAALWPFPPTEDFARGLNLFSRVFARKVRRAENVFWEATVLHFVAEVRLDAQMEASESWIQPDAEIAA